MRRAFTRALLAAALLLPMAAMAQPYPNRPVRIVVPFPPGGGTDSQSRAFAEALATQLGQRVIVDNRPGAGGNLGTDVVAKAPADGYTLLTGGPNIINTRYLIRDTPYQWERDLEPLGMMFSSVNVLVVHPSLPVRTVPEFIAHARANPGRLNFASAGAGGSIHLSGEMFMKMTGTEMVHVPYRGDALARADLTNGAVQVMFNTIATSIEPIRAGHWRGIATTGSVRAAALPELPTIAESGLPDYLVLSWMGLFAPKGVPDPVVARLRQAFDAVFADATNRAAFERLGVDVTPSSAADHLAFMRAQEATWAPILRTIEPQ
ncbi:Bug family tripartite tricarboxylate transporter substrate binding protein [Falsiroseomonas ponticola]|jgi:tripartite-type tricarboxylate transporter receptor subunit TctC|uniref:Bug family tripartite tricarboxylate transporter substrate binding protein n=1 Tax=Falsiroseomonas ponticola TaxID=2786951 RepID=UPI001932D4F4|nr:tripartite tricarboxylate transporter substrate binding protein [Roseomonas ponticola]